MNARSAAREFALFALFQMERKGQTSTSWEKAGLQELLLNTVRAVKALAQEEITTVADELGELQAFIADSETDHPDNLALPIGIPNRPVPIPTSVEMSQKLTRLLTAIEALGYILYLPEMEALAQREDVENYTHMLIRQVVKNQTSLDARIDTASEEWRSDRLKKMDRLLLRLAMAEIDYAKGVDTPTIIDEYLDLANRFSDDDGRKFVHGILGTVTAAPVESENRV